MTYFLAASVVLDLGMFLLTVMMHATRKTAILMSLYVAQSICVALYFALTAFGHGGEYLYVVALITLLSKVVLVPLLFGRVMRGMGSRFASDTYLDTPLTFTVLFILALFSFSVMHMSFPGTHFAALSPVLEYAPLHLTGILAALLLVVNRKEAFSQIIAILALENWVVFVASMSGFHQTLAVEVAVTMEIVVLMVVAAIFITMVFERFGSMDISTMTHLSELDDQ